MPARYEQDEPPPTPPGDLPPWRTTLPILAAIIGALLIIGVLAQLAHRSLPSP